SFFETNVNFLKGNIGAGFLSLPFAFAHAGYAGSIIYLLLIALIAVHCMHMLVKVKQHLADQGSTGYLSYADVRTIGRYGIYLVNFALLITQFGFCLVYILFIADHLNELDPAPLSLVLGLSFGLPTPLASSISVPAYALIVLPGAILLTWIRDFRTIAPTSIVATLCLIFSFIVIFGVYAIPPILYISLRCFVSQLPIFFGNSIFAFESIGLVLPMENSMAEPERFATVINIGMSVVVILYVSFGALGYMVFGDAVQGSITLNLPDTPIFDSVKIALCIALFQSIAIQFFPAINVLERAYMPVVERNVRSRLQTPVQLGIRSIIMCICAGLAIGIPKLGLVISLIGSLGAALLALIFPPLMHMRTFWHEMGPVVKSKDIFITFFGVVGM
ncbi:uncharacterized protein MONBRDRAFT_1039, partial [Monosiga brevicollis MX1]